MTPNSRARRSSDWSFWLPEGDRGAEVERLERELEESRAREAKARREAAEVRERFDRLLATSRRFSRTVRGKRDQQQMSLRRLAAQHAIDLVLAEADGLANAVPEVLKILGENFGWRAAVFWVADRDAKVLRCGEVWRRTNAVPDGFEQACRGTSLPRGEGLPGRAWKENRTVWTADLAREKRFGGVSAVEEGLRGALAFPIGGDGCSPGVVELLSDEELKPDREIFYTVGLVGRQLGQFAERRRAERARHEAHELLALATDASQFGWATLNAETGEMHWDARGRQILGFADRPVTAREWLQRIHPEDRPRVEAHTRGCIAGDHDFRMEYRIVRPDGQVRHIFGTGTFRRGADGSPRGTGLVQDITERKRAERERLRLRELEAAARAEAAERERISRELHDRVAHSMGVVHQSLQLYEALAEKDPERANDRLRAAKKAAKTALEQTRNLSMELRRSETRGGLLPALRDLLEVAVPDGIGVELSTSGEEASLPDHLRGQLYQILREAVRNAVRHSGCRRLTVGLEVAPEEVRGYVEDDGHGLEDGEDRDGIGLRSMRERAALLGGGIRIYPPPEGGTGVEVRAPLGHGDD